jgi:hypothetical protein
VKKDCALWHFGRKPGVNGLNDEWQPLIHRLGYRLLLSPDQLIKIFTAASLSARASARCDKPLEPERPSG